MVELEGVKKERFIELREKMKRDVLMKVVGEILLSDDHLFLCDVALGIDRRTLAAEILHEVAEELENARD